MLARHFSRKWRPMTPGEKQFYKTQVTSQLALKVSDQSKIRHFIEILKEQVIGLHLQSDGEKLSIRNGSPIVYNFSNNITSLKEGCKTVGIMSNADMDKSVGFLGYNDNQIVLSVNHLCADGGYFLDLVKLLSGTIQPMKERPNIPICCEELFENDIKKVGSQDVEVLSVDSKLTRITFPSPRKVDPNILISNDNLVLPISSLSFFDNHTKKLHGLTENLWASSVLTAMAFNHKFNEKVGVSTCLSLRPYLTDPHKFNNGLDITNCYASISALAQITKNTKVSDMASQMKQNFNRRVLNGAGFAYFNAMREQWDLPHVPGAGCEVSSIGHLRLMPPIEDAYMTCHFTAKNFDNIFTMMTFSVETPKRNDLTIQVRHADYMLTPQDTVKLIASLQHALTKLDTRKTVGEALLELSEVQKKA
ncbi:hypothetical protein TRFO_39570 [Tritrichomonas foetus]|uniref:Uncharacterized protein n=1 Tax=Tritrichomonas foetus TaxID=1144522 RepID=A0A1J4J4G0_9EUKA|nr:hypothetical protein TRFO_39570 [Tritrichomonas foetus]|eukprot:OHS94242.1 hypothetical protein TRFO_39570 [Tritrichomonas foetus]